MAKAKLGIDIGKSLINKVKEAKEKKEKEKKEKEPPKLH
jgi:hypothetical protein